MLDLGGIQFSINAFGLENVQASLRNLQTQINNADTSLNKFAFTSKDVKTAFLALGSAIGVISTTAVKVANDLDKSLNTLQAKTGAITEEMQVLEDSMKSIYANNYGEDFEDIANAMASIKQQTHLTGGALEEATTNAFALRDTFDWEVDESIRAVDMMMKQFGTTSKEAYNLLAQGAQNGLDKNQNLLDSVNEYSVHFKQLGFDVEEMFNMFSNGAEAGIFDLDKLGDAVKEFGIRAQDGSDTTIEAFKELGFNADEMQKKFASGGEVANQAFKDVAQALIDCDNKVTQNIAGVNLFGTMYEDLGIKAISALTNINGELSTQKDVLTSIKEIKYDDIGSAFAGIGRQIEVELLIPFGEKLLPYLNDFANWIRENKSEIIDGLGGALDKVSEAIEFLANNFEMITRVAGITLVSLLAFKTISTVVSVISTLTTAVGGLSTAFTFLSANPIAVAVLGISTAIGVVTVKAMEASAKQKEWNGIIEDSIILSEQLTELTAEQEAVATKNVNTITNQLTTYTQLTNQIAELDAQIAEYGDSTMELESAKNALVKESERALKAIEDEYGSYDNAIEVAYNYKEALDNNIKTKKTLEKYTDSYANSLVKETLQSSQLNKQTQNALDTYKKYNKQQILNNEETQAYNNAIKVLQANVSGLDVRFNTNTRLLEVNTGQVESSVTATNALNNAKVQQADTFQRMSTQIAIGSKDEAQAVIKSCEAAIDGLRAQRSAQMMFGGDITAQQKAEMEQYYAMIDKAKAKLNEVTTNIDGAVGSASKETGKATEKAMEDVVDKYIDMYNQKKNLGELEIKEQGIMLKELKEKHSDTAEHIIKVNDFALQESLDIIKQRKEKESLTTKEVIDLYQDAAKNYALTYNDKLGVTQAINEEIKGSVDNLVSDIDNLNDEDLYNLKNKLNDMKTEYKDYGYDVEEIEKRITEVVEEQYQRQLDKLKETVGMMKDERKKLYDDEVSSIDAEAQKQLDANEAKIKAIEDTQRERDRLEREQRYQDKINIAKTIEERIEAEEEYTKWLQEEKEKREIQDLKDANTIIKDKAKEDKEKAKTKYEQELEQIEIFQTLEIEKLNLRKTYTDKSEEDITSKALQEYTTRKSDLIKYFDEQKKEFNNQTPILQTISKTYGDALYDGITGRNSDINSYLSSLAQSVRDAMNGSYDEVKTVDGSHRNGLAYVPYDGYIAELHKGERVLTQQENINYKNNVSNTSSINYNVTQNINSTSSNAYEQQRQATNNLKKLGLMY